MMLSARKERSLIPGYKYLVVYRDLYTVWGGELDWFYGSRGVYTFSNELFNSYQYFHKNRDDDNFDSGEAYEFDKSLLFGDAIVSWHEYDHPQFGKIEIGGPKKNYTHGPIRVSFWKAMHIGTWHLFFTTPGATPKTRDQRR